MSVTQTLRRLTITLAMAFACLTSFAYSFEVGGIYYDKTGGNTVSVTSSDNSSYNGSVIIPKSVTFEGTTYSVTSIGSSAFSGCSGLTSVTIPGNIYYVGNYAFSGCSSLGNITIEDPEEKNDEDESVSKSFSNWMSTNHSDSSTSYEEYNFDVNAGDVLTFNYSVSSESGYDFLIVKLNGTEIVKESGSKSGNYRKVFETAEHVNLYMAYTKDSSQSSGSDEASVTDIWLNGTAMLTLGSNGSKPLFSDCPLDEVYIGRKLSYSTSSTYGYSPFYRNTSLRTVKITNAETKIYDNEFYGCSGLQTLEIGDSVTTIGSRAFYGCISLTSVSIPESVTTIGNSAFSDCTSLQSLAFNAINCNGFSYNDLRFPSSITMVTIGDKVTKIPDYFVYGSKITNLTIPNSVTSIGSSAFSGCSRLKSVTIGSAISSIGSKAFDKCTIYKAFWLCNTPPNGASNLNAKVNYVSNNEFSLSNKKIYPFLSSMFEVDNVLYVPVSPSDRTCDVVDCNYLNSSERTIISDKVNNKGVELTVLNINEYSFCSNSIIKNISLSNQGDIGSSAFSGCGSLQTATISNQGNIGSYAFRGASNLSKATLGEMVSGIGESAFYGCKALAEVIIPNSVKSLGSYAFSGCSALSNVSIGKGVSSLPDGLFSGCSSLPEITIPSNISTIGDNVFSGCSSLGYVTIEDPEEKNDEDESVSKSFSNWMSTNHSDSSTSYEEYNFDVNAGDVLTFDYSVSSESGYDFLIVKLNGTEIVKESGSKSGNYRKVFETAEHVNLYMAYTKDSSQSSGSDNASVTDIWLNIAYLTLGSNGSNPLFSDCPLDEVYIGRKLSYSKSSSDGYSPFYRNTSLRTVKITNAETKIYDNEFYGCSGLESLEIGDGVTTIGSWAFSGCSAMQTFACGSSVETIGEEAFSDCTGLTSFKSKAVNPPVCGNQALDDINKWECTLHVPAASEPKYQAAPQWKEFFFVNGDASKPVTAISLQHTAEMKVGETQMIRATVTPADATDATIEWSSSDESVASVNYNGTVTAKAPGTVTITATAADGSGVTASCEIIVIEPSGISNVDAAEATVRVIGGEIVVDGAPVGTVVRIFAVDGMELYRSVSTGEAIVFAPGVRGVCLVAVGNRCVKISL